MVLRVRRWFLVAMVGVVVLVGMPWWWVLLAVRVVLVVLVAMWVMVVLVVRVVLVRWGWLGLLMAVGMARRVLWVVPGVLVVPGVRVVR